MAGQQVIAGDDAAVMPEKEKIASNDGCGHVRNPLLQGVNFLRPVIFVTGPRSDELFAISALPAGDKHHSTGDNRRCNAALNQGISESLPDYLARFNVDGSKA